MPCRPAPEVVTPAVRCGKIGQGSDFVVSADTSIGISFDKGRYQKTEGKLVAGLLLVLKKRNDIVTSSPLLKNATRLKASVSCARFLWPSTFSTMRLSGIKSLFPFDPSMLEP